MTAAAAGFYVTGGTLRPDAPSYVPRQADRDLFDALSHGEFCYVLHARQMGKSSLMARCAQRLRQAGVAVASLDLQAVGQNLSVEQWYDGLLSLVGQQLGLEDELDDFWLDHARLGPLQRWMGALREVVLKGDARRQTPVARESAGSSSTGDGRLTSGVSKVVLFIDEIDAVRALPFSADEFFAGIRECYNRRVREPEYARLTFCLLGVASPSDLIRDVRTSPFNIGRRIELTDFTEAEAAPLAVGLLGKESFTTETRRHGGDHGGAAGGDGEKLLQRIVYWTGGHPYLTQRLCQAVATDGRVSTISDVDRLCEELFFSPRARERDDNLLFVRDRLLRSEGDVASLLGLYAQVRSPRQKVADDEGNPLVTLLRLSGIVRAEGGVLKVRNRIYARVFDGAWVTGNMPGAEVRRLRALAREEGRKRREAEEQRQRAEERERMIRRLLYAAQMNLAQQAWKLGNVGRANELLEAHRPELGQEDLRGFEWRYLWRLCQDESLCTCRGHTGMINAVAVSPDGTLLASSSADNTVKLWEIATRRVIATIPGHSAWSEETGVPGHPRKVGASSAAFSPDGKTLAIGASLADMDCPGELKVWDVATQRERLALTKHRGGVSCVAFSPDGSILVTGSFDQTAKLWDAVSGRELATLQGHAGRILCVAFSPDGKTLATGDSDQTVKLWDVARRQEVTSFKATLRGSVLGLAFSPNGKTLATGAWDPVAKLWDVTSRRQVAALKGHRNRVLSVAFSPNGKTLVTASDDTTAKLWDVATQRAVHTFVGHTTQVSALALSADGRTVITGSQDGAVKLWGVRVRQAADLLQGHTGPVNCVQFSPDGRILASGGTDNTVKLWEVASQRVVATFPGHSGWNENSSSGQAGVNSVAFSPDGKTLAIGADAGNEPNVPAEVRLWDVVSRCELVTLREKIHAGEPRRQEIALAFSPDGRLLASGTWSEAATLWDVTSRREVARLEGHRVGSTFLAFSPDGKILAAAAGFENAVQLWAIPSRHRVASLKTSDAAINVAFAPDGRTLAAGVRDGTVRLWETGSWRQLGTLDGLAGWSTVAFSPEGNRLATGHQDGTVMLWSVAQWQVAATLEGHEAAITQAAFSPDGNLLATASNDGMVRLWRAATFAETDALAG
jgi:WD40 repeat protein